MSSGFGEARQPHPKCPESRRYYNEDPGGGPGAGGEGLGVAGDRRVRYFSPALLPMGLAPVHHHPVPSRGRREEGLSLVGPPCCRPGGAPTAPGTADPVLTADARRGGLRSGAVSTGHSWQKGQCRSRFDDQGQTDCSQQLSCERRRAGRGRPRSEPLSSTTWEDSGPRWLWSRVRHWAEAVGTADGTWALQRRALWGDVGEVVSTASCGSSAQSQLGCSQRVGSRRGPPGPPAPPPRAGPS